MRYTVAKSQIDVVGHIWQPGVGLCAHTYTLRPYDLKNIGEWTRANVERWLACNSGDFKGIVDFRADFSTPDGRDWVSDWTREENMLAFMDCMDPAESEASND